MSDKLNQELEFAFKEIQGSTGFSMDRNRPYDGQPHTHSGERGQTKVEGLTMRDVADCVVKGFLNASGLEIKDPIHDDIYKIELDDIDPGAVIQNMVCHIERMMGIFPNINNNGKS